MALKSFFFYVSSSSPQLLRTCFFVKTTKIPILQQVTDRDTPILVSLEMHHLRKYYNLKTEKKCYEAYTKKKTLDKKLSQRLKSYKMNFIN